MKKEFLHKDEILKLNGSNFLFKDSIKEISSYLSKASTVRRGPYFLSEETTEKYEKVRYEIADLLGASSREIIFASPNDVNKLLNSIRKVYLIEELKNFKNIEELKLFTMAKHVDEKLVMVNANSFISRLKINIKILDIDVLYINSDFLYSPNDLLIFYVKREILENIEPYEQGGDMIKKVTLHKSNFAEPPYKFEAGTPNIASILSLGPSVKFIKNHLHELDELFVSFYLNLSNIVNISINDLNKTIEFMDKNQEIREIFKKEKIDIGDKLQLSIYNDREDIDRVINILKRGF